MNKHFPKYTDAIVYCNRKDLLNDNLGKALNRAWQLGCCDDELGEMIMALANNHTLRETLKGPELFKKPKLTKGNFLIGKDCDGNDVITELQYQNANTLTVAGAGAGKTTLLTYLMLVNAREIARHAKIMAIDLRKGGFSELIPHLAAQGISMLEMPARSLKFNPLQLPDGVDISTWAPQIAQTLIDVLGLPERASKKIQSTLILLYQKFAPLGLSPTLFDLYLAVKEDKSCNSQSRAAILDSLEPVLLSLGPEVLAYQKGWSSGNLARQHLCLNLAAVSEVDKNLILNSMLLAEFVSRISRGISNCRMDLWICLDEAQRICSGMADKSAIGHMICIARGTAIGLNLSVQTADGVLPQIMSNTATKIMGRCGSFSDYQTMGRHMGLSSEQIHWCQMNLRPGTFVCQLGEGRFRYPFVFSVPEKDIPFVVGSVQIDLPNSLDQVPTVYASEFHNWGKAPELITPKADPEQKPKAFESESEYRFCRAVVNSPMQNSSSYIKLARVSQKSARPIRESLISKKYIKGHTIESGGRGRSSILLEVTKAGIEAISTYENTGETKCVD